MSSTGIGSANYERNVSNALNTLRDWFARQIADEAPGDEIVNTMSIGHFKSNRMPAPLIAYDVVSRLLAERGHGYNDRTFTQVFGDIYKATILRMLQKGRSQARMEDKILQILRMLWQNRQASVQVLAAQAQTIVQQYLPPPPPPAPAAPPAQVAYVCYPSMKRAATSSLPPGPAQQSSRGSPDQYSQYRY